MNIKIFQIYYQLDQQKYLDINFTPFSNIRNNNPDWREYWVFKEVYEKGLHKEADYTGFLSWRFNEKTRIDGRRFFDFINTNTHDNFDVFFINPLPWDLDCFDNLWLQGDYYHKGILNFAQNILTKCGININLREIVHGEDTGAYCNYWVGNQYFWDEYMRFTLPVYKYLSEDLSDEERDFLYSDSNYHISANYIPFIMERMFSTLLSYNENIKALGFKYTLEEIYRLTLNNYRVVRDNYYYLESRIEDHEKQNKNLAEYAESMTSELEQSHKTIQELKDNCFTLQNETVNYQSENHRLKSDYEELLEQNKSSQQENDELKQACELYKNSPAVRFSNELNRHPFLKKVALALYSIFRGLYLFLTTLFRQEKSTESQ